MTYMWGFSFQVIHRNIDTYIIIIYLEKLIYNFSDFSIFLIFGGSQI